MRDVARCQFRTEFGERSGARFVKRHFGFEDGLFHFRKRSGHRSGSWPQRSNFRSHFPHPAALYPNKAPLPHQPDMTILRPFALISPGLREPDKPRFVHAHRTDRPANRPEFFAPRPLLKLARTMAQRKLSQSRRSSHGPVICRRSWSWKVRSDRRCAEQYRARLQRSCMP